MALTPEERQDRDMSEAALQKAVLELAKEAGWDLRFHVRAGRAHWNLGSGLPDLVLIRVPRLIVAELKRQGKHPEPEQVRWLTAFEKLQQEHGIPEVYVWRPSDLRTGLIEDVLL